MAGRTSRSQNNAALCRFPAENPRNLPSHRELVRSDSVNRFNLVQIENRSSIRNLSGPTAESRAISVARS